MYYGLQSLSLIQNNKSEAHVQTKTKIKDILGQAF